MQYSLKELRARHSLSQEDMAKELKVSKQTYNAWEKDYGKIRVSFANAIASNFCLTLNDFFLRANMNNIHV